MDTETKHFHSFDLDAELTAAEDDQTNLHELLVIKEHFGTSQSHAAHQTWFASGRRIRERSQVGINPFSHHPSSQSFLSSVHLSHSSSSSRSASSHSMVSDVRNPHAAPPPLNDRSFAVLPRFDWTKLSHKLTELHKLRARMEAHKQRFLTTSEMTMYEDFSWASRSGDERLMSIMRTLDMFKSDASDDYVVRSAEQRLFHLWFLQACLPHIYGKQWERSSKQALGMMSRLMGRPDNQPLKRVHSEVFCLTPRRFGKTWSVAMLVAALLIWVPGIKIGVFSTAQRVSSWLMDRVVKFIYDIEGCRRRIVTQTQEQLFLSKDPLPDGCHARSPEAAAMAKEKTTSRFFSYPSSVNSECAAAA